MIFIRDDLKTVFKSEQTVDAFLAIDGRPVKQVVADRRTIYFERGGRGFYLKAHLGVGWKEIVKNLLQLRLPVLGAKNEWQGILALEHLGVPTMRLAAYGQQGVNPATRKSFVVTDALEQTEDLESWLPTLTSAQEDVLLKWAVIRTVAGISRTLHSNGINHRDYYLCHLRIDLAALAQQQNKPRIYVMDLHRLEVRPATPERWLVKDIAGLLYSTLHAPGNIHLTRSDVLRFIAVYDGMSWRQSLTEHRHFWQKVLQRVISTHKKGAGGAALPPFMNRWLEMR
ncbi:MAG: lipopolysaccharide core heptose(I) kinase RfaP [Deltaproteobacteria bacterium]|nr:lipopolysaccharide core heptose(I) kinase RfaP [Candidatus Anaeroferrophillus wilburensis]MBN2889050.1 lipopolysaccharide core heptose(I) kinase RfaP [Deltaproteobacteria bacterium]